jgi:prepilin-type processing-associated H-X9-DG protein
VPVIGNVGEEAGNLGYVLHFATGGGDYISDIGHHLTGLGLGVAHADYTTVFADGHVARDE